MGLQKGTNCPRRKPTYASSRWLMGIMELSMDAGFAMRTEKSTTAHRILIVIFYAPGHGNSLSNEITPCNDSALCSRP